MITPPIDFARLALFKSGVAIGEDEVKAAVVRRCRRRPIGHFPEENRRRSINHLSAPASAYRVGDFISGAVRGQINVVPNVGDVVVVLYHLLIAGDHWIGGAQTRRAYENTQDRKVTQRLI